MFRVCKKTGSAQYSNKNESTQMAHALSSDFDGTSQV